MSKILTTSLSYQTARVEISREKTTLVIGERINPTGRKKVLAALEANNFAIVQQDAVKQLQAGAAILDINAGVPGANEVELLPRLMSKVMEVSSVPLCIDTANPQALEAALKIYPGKALVNSVNGEEQSIRSVLPIVKEYGAAVIALCISDEGIPASAEARLTVAGKILERAAKIGIPPEDIVLDPLAMAIGADHTAGLVTLKTIQLFRDSFGVNITLGASNVSFGLPDRSHLNSTFLAMCIHAGVSCPITNPLSEDIQLAILAADLAMGRDAHATRWIKAYRKRKKAAEDKTNPPSPTLDIG